ncbi:uncharacterized protein PRCAT00003375001 [Priceomyces carsonii]|uniref:uncharacterized protein n=1 Tax=Priceomyces carsonii TaxID=28549 RepID=UPI002ED8618D|nr:unnamed protein product [Priceomyces carsonii]
MGNAPSRDDSSNTVNQTLSDPSTGISGELESEEQGGLSRQYNSKYNDSNDQYKTRKDDDKANCLKTTPAIKIERKTKDSASKSNKKDSSSPRKFRRSSFADHDLDLDLEIGVSAAKLLTIPSEYHSSVESSDISIASPVFTSSGETKDVDLLLSVGSGNSPKQNGGFGNYKEDSKESLEPIVEGSLESTPEPGKVPSKTGFIKKNSIGKFIKPQSSKNSLGEELTKLASISSTSTSGSPPLAPSSKKFEIDIDAVIDKLLNVGMKKQTKRSSKEKFPISPNEIRYIVQKARSVFLTQPSLLRLSPPVKIVGDIHGQFHDLVRIFNVCGYPPYSNYLFLGDYVDRGPRSLEIFLLLLSFKIKYPENFFMLRGNHESANITKIYGFYDECKRRLSSRKIWKDFVDVFNTLPIAATINDKIFCIHGGLSPDLHDLNQIETIKRPTDVPDSGLLADLLWSDPDPAIRSSSWTKNDRGVSYCFGKKHVDHFCAKFKMDLIVRGHMVVEDGYEFFNKRKLVTVFLAPNYCGEFNNFGSVMKVDRKMCCSFQLIKPHSE